MIELMANIDGAPVPLTDCEWVMWGACGCPVGCAYADSGHGSPLATEEQIWKNFFPLKRDREQRQKKGYRMELMTRAKWSAEVYPRMRTGCIHRPTT